MIVNEEQQFLEYPTNWSWSYTRISLAVVVFDCADDCNRDHWVCRFVYWEKLTPKMLSLHDIFTFSSLSYFKKKTSLKFLFLPSFKESPLVGFVDGTIHYQTSSCRVVCWSMTCSMLSTKYKNRKYWKFVYQSVELFMTILMVLWYCWPIIFLPKDPKRELRKKVTVFQLQKVL